VGANFGSQYFQRERCVFVKVLKFGGSSLGSPQRIRDVSAIVLKAVKDGPTVLVVSAFQGITNELIDSARLAERRDAGWRQSYLAIAKRHRMAIDTLFPGRPIARLRTAVDAQLVELHDALHGVQLLGHCPPAALDIVASFGERLSAAIVAAYLRRSCRAEFVDARQFVTTDDQFTSANVNFAKTNRAARRYFSALWRESNRTIPVVTGFIGCTEDGRTTTIGRNGSDYTAAIVGAALDVSMIEIWTDVDGVLSADPKAVASAFVLPQITYEEAMEMSYFGAKVLHAGTIGPAVAKSIPILIKNTFNPQSAGTLVSRQPTTGPLPNGTRRTRHSANGNGFQVNGHHGRGARRAGGTLVNGVNGHIHGRVNGHQLAKGVSSIGEVTLLSLRGQRLLGAPGTTERLFRALASHGVNVILISQASSEHTICLAVSNRDVAAAEQAVTQEFAFDLQHGALSLEKKADQAIIAVVGEGMKGRPGAAGKLFGALGRHNINVSAIAQGASERNISCVIEASQQRRALNVIHQGFFEARKSLHLAVVGVGNIGSTVLRQLGEQRSVLLEQGFDVKVVALANSRRFVVASEGIDLAHWREALDAATRPMHPASLASALATLELANGALVDCTADAAIVDSYPQFVAANLHVITPNKRANTLPWPRYTALRDVFASHQRHFLFETNVGAGLPIISTLRDLVVSGDVVNKVEGVFSGTLSYLFNTFDGTVPFSALLRDALRLGFTEPDPREDLSGQDVARKLLILARQIGLKMDLENVGVASLVPRQLSAGPFSERFFAAYAAYDDEIAARIQRARSRDRVLRYVGTIENGRARAELKEFPRDHPFAATMGSDNIIAFTTKRYSRTPMIVQGPGAGADVTAMGVFSDIFKLLNYLPH
jgi:aspartokinase/homoserine dehydrogenase 1